MPSSKRNDAENNAVPGRKPDGNRYVVPAGRHVYTMDKAHPPSLQTDVPARVTARTLDCYNDQVTPDPATRRHVDQKCYNPAAGPIEVKGATPGDVLAVRVVSIRPRPYGIVNVRPKHDGDEHLVAVLRVEAPNAIDDTQGVAPHVVWDRRTGAPQRDSAHSDSAAPSMRLPYRPMIGVIGVAPAGAPVSTVTPDDHGGNMDVREIAPGSRLYLPVQTPGALLSLGDVHAVMGDGETSGSGVEISAEIQLEIDILKNRKLRRPLVETDEAWLWIASARTLDEAAALAVDDAVAHLARAGMIRRAEARLLVGQLGDLRVAQLVNPNKTMKLFIRKEELCQALPHIAARGLVV